MLDSSPQFEGRRQAYLAALGIPLWTVRQELSHAAPSSPTTFVAFEDTFFTDVNVDAGSASNQTVIDELPDVQTSTEAFAPEIPALSSPPEYDDEPPLEAYFDDPEYQQAAAIDGFKHVLAPPPVAKSAPPASKLATSQEQPIQFKFGVYACGQWQIIVPRSQLLSPSEAQLLANIQRALPASSSQPILFTWPMVNNYAIPRHKKAAQEALVSFFRSQALSQKGYILLADYEQDLAGLLMESTKKPVVIQPSLSMLLQQPLQKKALWLALNQ
jgi:hypothetical protein